MKRNILPKLFIVMLLCWHTAAMATISVHIDPPTVQLGETFRLTLSLDDPRAAGIPDLTPLQESFTIVGTERNMSYTIINGETHSVGQWTVLLTAKKTGVLPIPVIQMGHQQSLPSSVEVVDGKVTLDDERDVAHDELMLKTDISSRDVFVNQQVIYTVKLYNSQRLLDAEYLPPRVEDALLVPLGSGRRYQTILNGRSYAVEEQQYAIFPQKSGDLKIISPSFNALVFDAVPRRMNVHAATTQLVVKPKPASYLGKYWLPAKQFALTETYDKPNTTMSQGSTLVRTITLQAAGVPAQLLPPLTFASTAGYNTYPDKPGEHNTAREKDLIGRTDIKVTYLLNETGRITIPALQVPWFNTNTGKEERATLPARTIEIEAVKGRAPQAKTMSSPASIKKTSAFRSIKSLPPYLEKQSVGLAWWLAGGFALAWLVTLVLWWSRRSAFVSGRSKRRVLKRLHHACKNNNPNQAEDALLCWARMQWPQVEFLHVHHLAKWVYDTTLKKQLFLLSEAIYSQGSRSERWRGDMLWRSLIAYLRTRPTTKGKNSDLPPINPG